MGRLFDRLAHRQAAITQLIGEFDGDDDHSGHHIGRPALVLASGSGAEARGALGWVIVGGQGMAAVATLYLTPVAYLLLASFSKPKAMEEARLERELSELDEIAEPAE